MSKFLIHDDDAHSMVFKYFSYFFLNFFVGKIYKQDTRWYFSKQ